MDIHRTMQFFFYDDAWFLVGDLNQILSGSERHDGIMRGVRNASRMAECLENRGLMDLSAWGPKYTWCNIQFGGDLVMKRLDRAIANLHWRLQFPEAIVYNLPRTHGDHNPILIKLHGAPLLDRSHRLFRFEAAWLTHPDFNKMLQESWLSNGNITETIDFFTAKVKEWNLNVFGHINKQKRRILARVVGVQKATEKTPRRSLFELETRLINAYNAILEREEILWFQKSRCKWIQYGDRNTKFFHASTIVRRRRSRISSLQDENGSCCTNDEKIKEITLSFFRNLYHDVGQSLDPTPFLNFDRGSRLNEQQLLDVLRPITPEEIKRVIFSMGSYKAPGSDGLHAKFFQANWDVVGPAVCQFVMNAFEEGQVDRKANEALLCIIPKTEHPEKASHF